MKKITHDGTIISRKEAKAFGLAYYFTGKPCIHGHIETRSVSTKKCHECNRLHVVKFKNRDVDRHKALRRAFYEKNKEKILMEQKEYRIKNADEYKRKSRESARKYRLEKPELERAKNKRYRERHIEETKARASRNKGRRRGAEGKFTVEDIRALFDAQRGKCAYCKTSIKSGYHIDHIHPIAKGGTNWPKNLQLTCQRCNHVKSAKDPVEFAREIGRLI